MIVTLPYFQYPQAAVLPQVSVFPVGKLLPVGQLLAPPGCHHLTMVMCMLQTIYHKVP